MMQILTNENGWFDPLDGVHQSHPLHWDVIFGKARQVVEEFFHFLQIGPSKQKVIRLCIYNK